MHIKDFAARGGVTVKALLHYDRLGLLTPARTPAGHRVYGDRDLNRLRRILVLKAMGIGLSAMRGLLDADAATLSALLATRRDAIAREQDRLRRADRALALVEEGLRHQPAEFPALDRLADIHAMPAVIDAMNAYFDDDVWPRARRFYEAWPGDDWIELLREVAAQRDTRGPLSDDLARRYNRLALALWSDLAPDYVTAKKLHEGFARAWRDRDRWPAAIRRRFADYDVDLLARLLGGRPDTHAAAS